MTDNEKAAHFIGWKPELCEAKHPLVMTHGGQKRVRCKHNETSRHTIEAPDMSLPANYMKAVRELVLRGLFVEVMFYLAEGGPYAHYTIWPKEGRRSDDDEPLVDVLKSMDREPSVEILMLVALYDAEHKA